MEERAMNLYRLDASIRLEGSVTRAVADSAESGWHSRNPGGSVVRRELGLDPLPARTWIDAVGASVNSGPLTLAQEEAVALVSCLADEILGADALLLAIPMYNFGVPHHVKAWVDAIMTDPRLRPVGGQPLAGKPAILILARSGGYAEGTSRFGWDHNTPWLRRIFADALGLDLHVTEVELTLAHVNPAMKALRDQADQTLDNGHALARSQGVKLAEQLLELAVA